MFKRICLTLITFGLFSLTLMAQTSDSTTVATTPKTTQTLFGKIKPKLTKVGLYVAPEFQYFGAANSFAPASGGSAMFLFNEKLGLGIAAYRVENFTPKALNNTALRMRYNYGGAKIEYSIAPHGLVHVTIPVLIGAGMANVDSVGAYRSFDEWDGDGRRGRNFRENGNDNPFFVIQPGLRLETNLFRYAKLFVGADYRIVAGTNSVTYPSGTTTAAVSNSQLSGLSFSAGLKLGLFDYAIRKKK